MRRHVMRWAQSARVHKSAAISGIATPCWALRCAALCCAVLWRGRAHWGSGRGDSVGAVQIHEEAQRKAEAEAAAVVQEQQQAAEEAEHLAAAAKQRASTVHQIQVQREAEARKKCDPTPKSPNLGP